MVIGDLQCSWVWWGETVRGFFLFGWPFIATWCFNPKAAVAGCDGCMAFLDWKTYLCWRNFITSDSCQKDASYCHIYDLWLLFPDEFTGGSLHPVPWKLWHFWPAEVGGMREAKNLEMLQRLGISSLVNASPDVVHVPGAAQTSLEKTQVELFRCRLKSDCSAVWIVGVGILGPQPLRLSIYPSTFSAMPNPATEPSFNLHVPCDMWCSLSWFWLSMARTLNPRFYFLLI